MTDTNLLKVPYIRAHGDPFSAGRQHGAALSEALHAFLADGLTRLHRILPKPVTLASLGPRLAAFSDAISAQTPELAEELRGLAQGADISYEQAVLLQVRREIMGYSKIPTMGDCTTYARAGASRFGAAVLAQTVDLNGDLDDQISVLDVARPDTGRRALVLSFGGLLGYLGITSDGLAIGLNLVLGGDWRPGLPPYLAIRHLLDTATGVDDAVAILRGLRLASSRSLMMCDASKAVYVEILGDEIRVVDAQELAHTNHFLHPDFVSRDELNVFARNSSVLRLKACQAALTSLPADASAEEHFGLMSAAPICVADTGDVRRERTVAAVVMRPALGELHVRPGDPSRSATQSFSLAAP